MALPTTGTSRLGVMPDASALKQIPRTGPEDQQEDIRLEDRLTNQTASGRKEQPVSEDTAMLSASSKKPQYFLAAPGLPTITSKLAEQIWDREFVEMEEFLTSNKTMQALEQQFNPKSVQDGVLGALQQFQQQQQQGQRVADIITWTRCFTLYIAVMANKRADLIPPMVAHMHAVLKLQQSMGGMTWLQYDWKSWREMSATGTQTWEKRDPWQLLSCFAGSRVLNDSFDSPAQGQLPSTSQKQHLTKGTGSTAKPQVGRPQPYGQSQGRKPSVVCRLFNRAPAGCPYGNNCIFNHRCTNCRQDDHISPMAVILKGHLTREMASNSGPLELSWKRR